MTIPGLGADDRLDTATRAETESGQQVLDALRTPVLTVLWHADLGRVGERSALSALSAGGSSEISRTGPRFAHPGSAEARPLQDAHLSRDPIRIRPSAEAATWVIERGTCRAKIRVDGVVLESSHVVDREALARGVVIELGRRVSLLLHRARPVSSVIARHGLVGESDLVVGLRQQIDMVAGLDLTVLLRGESGTGKELAARALHQASPRSNGPFIAVNMAAIPPTLAAAELFGAAKGAYTGATRTKAGFFERAQGGTLFLDEVGETPLDVQALLLRALETREIQPVGSVETRPVDVRVIAATDSDLERGIADGRVRAPLFHRLAGYQIELPPLRARLDDLGRLFVHFLEEMRLKEMGSAEMGRSLDALPDGRPWAPASMMTRLAQYSWPGNVRQLKNAVQRLSIAQQAGADLDAVLDELLLAVPSTASRTGIGESVHGKSISGVSEVDPRPARRTFRDPTSVTEDELLAALDGQAWRIQPTAQTLGISRGALYRLIDACPGIRKAVDLQRDEIARALRASDGDLENAAARLRVSSQGLKRRVTALGSSLGS